MMSGFAKSPSDEGYIYFNTLVSFVKKFPDNDFEEFLTSLKNNKIDSFFENLGECKNMLYKFNISSIFKSIIVHEQTHFLDLTCTQWGLEYNYRKINYLNERTREKAEVFFLNSCELLEMHLGHSKENLISTYKDVTQFNHSIEYNKDLGAIVFIHFTLKNKSSQKIPVTMLSLIESHAFSNEYLSRITDAKYIKDKENRKKFLKRTIENYHDFLDSPKAHEYNIFNNLIHIHFEKYNLNTEELLRLTSAIMGFSLEIESSEMSLISNPISKGMHSPYTDLIQAELMRGQLRHVVALKTILMMYDLTKSLKATERKILKNILKTNPSAAIKRTWDYYTSGQLSKYKNFIQAKKYLRQSLISELNTEKYPHAHQIFKESTNQIESFIKNNFTIKNLNEYKLLDMIRDSNSLTTNAEIINFPNRYNIDTEQYFFSTELSEIEEALSSDHFLNIKKQHLSPEDATNMIDILRRPK